MVLFDPVARQDVPAWPETVPPGMTPDLNRAPETNKGFIFTNLFTASLMLIFVGLRLCSKILLVIHEIGWEDCE